MKKFDFGRLFNNKRFMVFFSILTAFCCWLFVVYQIDTITSLPIKNLQVVVNTQQLEMLEASGLDIVGATLPKVRVEVEGERAVLANLNESDIRVEANLSGVTTAGTHTVNLVGYDTNDNGFTITKIVPDKISVKVVRPATRKFAITTDIVGLATPDGYLRGNTVLNPREVEISGAEVDVNKIDKCVVHVEFSDPLTTSANRSGEIKLYDIEGNELSKELFTMEHDTADVTIPVQKMASVPVKFEYSRVPSGFPVEQLQYKILDGHEEIRVAAQESVMDTYSEVFLGYVNINEISRSGNEVTFDVELPSGFSNVDEINQITVEFATDALEEVVFAVSDIRVVNTPANYDVRIDTQQISGVVIVGDPEVLAALSPEDVIAEIDLSERDISPGPYNSPVKIVIPGSKFAWATGDYSAVVVISEKE